MSTPDVDLSGLADGAADLANAVAAGGRLVALKFEFAGPDDDRWEAVLPVRNMQPYSVETRFLQRARDVVLQELAVRGWRP